MKTNNLFCRILLVIISILVISFIFVGCNYQAIDTTYSYDKAYIDLGDKVICVDVASWRDFDDGEQLQIKSTDGKVYLTSSFRCVLVKE